MTVEEENGTTHHIRQKFSETIRLAPTRPKTTRKRRLDPSSPDIPVFYVCLFHTITLALSAHP